LLQAIDPLAAETDWKMLNVGWAMADAILTSAENLRVEDKVVYTPRSPVLFHCLCVVCLNLRFLVQVS